MRTTVILSHADKALLHNLAELEGVSEMEAIRRSIRLTAELVQHQKSGGAIVLEKGRTRERIRFLL